jgi:protein SCO1
MTSGPRRCLIAFALMVASLFCRPAAASLTAEQLAAVGVVPPPGATLPLDAPLAGLDGRPTTLRLAMAGHPAVLVFADYRCTQLCSPILSVAGAMLAASGLAPGTDYRLIVVGFNPRATAADARAMVGGQIGFDTPVGRATFPLMGSRSAVERLTRSVGYRFAYDSENDRFAHPAALLIVTSDGRLSRVLAGLAITGDDARRALIEARSGGVAAFVNRVRLLCYGLGASVGRYVGPVRIALAAAGAATVLVVVAGLLFLTRASARGPT